MAVAKKETTVTLSMSESEAMTLTAVLSSINLKGEVNVSPYEQNDLQEILTSLRAANV